MGGGKEESISSVHFLKTDPKARYQGYTFFFREPYRGIHTRAFRHEPPRGYLLPIPGCDTVNIHLKKIARLCGITKTLTFHMARHTFATTICLENGVPIETVSKMLGHRFISTTKLYAKVSKSKIAREMQPLMGSNTTRELRKALRVCPPRKPRI